VVLAGGPLLGLDPLNGRAGPLPVDPPAWVARLRAKRPVRVGDLVGEPVLLDLGRSLATPAKVARAWWRPSSRPR